MADLNNLSNSTLAKLASLVEKLDAKEIDDYVYRLEQKKRQEQILQEQEQLQAELQAELAKISNLDSLTKLRRQAEVITQLRERGYGQNEYTLAEFEALKRRRQIEAEERANAEERSKQAYFRSQFEREMSQLEGIKDSISKELYEARRSVIYRKYQGLVKDL